MEKQKCVDTLGYIIVCEFVIYGFLGLLPSKLYLLCNFSMIILSIIRIRLFYQIPKKERRIYDFSNPFTASGPLLHPYSQPIIVFPLCIAGIRAELL